MRVSLRVGPLRLRLVAPGFFYAIVPYRVGVGLTSSLLPLFLIQVVGGTVADVGRVTALSALVGAPALVFWGNLSDRLRRRRPFLVSGFLGFAVSAFLIGRAHSVHEVVVLSMIGALFSSAVEPVASALVVDQLPQERWAECFGRFNQIGGWGFVAGMVLGTGWLASLPRWWGTAASMRGLFLCAGAVAFTSLMLTLRWLPEPTRDRKGHRFPLGSPSQLSAAVIGRVLHHGARLRYLALRRGVLLDAYRGLCSSLGRFYSGSLLLFLANALGFVVFPVFLIDLLGATSTQVFLIFLLKAVVDVLLYMPMGRMVQRRPGMRLLAQASAVRMGIFGAYALIALCRPGGIGLIAVALVHILTGVTWAAFAVAGSTAVAMVAPRGLEGRAMGLYNGVIGLAGVLGSLAGGYLAEAFGYVVPLAGGAAGTGIAAVWFWRLRQAALEPTPSTATAVEVA